MPLQDIEAGALGLAPDAFLARYGFPKPAASDKLVFSCKGGIRGGAACALAEAAGFTRVFNNTEGARGDNFNDS